MNKVEETVCHLETESGEMESAISDTCKCVISANTGLIKIKQICEIMTDYITVVANVNPSTLTCFRYAPITSTQSGSRAIFFYNGNILSDRQQSLTEECLQ